MKLQKILLAVLFVTPQLFVAGDVQQTSTTQVTKCACGPTEHWLYKVCVQNYMAQFPQAGLKVSDDSEGLSENIVQAIAMIAQDLSFVDDQGDAIVPTLSAKGNLLLPMSKTADYKLIKAMMHEVDTTTTLSAQELYALWKAQLQAMKSAQ